MSEFRDKIKEIDKLIIDKLTEDDVISLETLLIEVIKEDVRIRCEDDLYSCLLSNPSPPNLTGILNMGKEIK